MRSAAPTHNRSTIPGGVWARSGCAPTLAPVDWLIDLMRTIGAPGVGVATALETVFPPIPSEAVLPLAGYTAGQGHYGVVAAVVWATVGSLVGALVLYWAGAAWGYDRLYAMAERIPLMRGRDVEKSMDWFERHGRVAILIGRLVPGVRSLISIPAGVERMPLLVFVTFTVLGSAAWNSLLIGSGYALGSQWETVEQYVGSFSNVIYAAIALTVVAFVGRRLWKRRHHEDDPAG